MKRFTILLLLVAVVFSLPAQTQQKQATISGGGSTTGPATNATRKLFSVVGQAVAVQSVNTPASFADSQSGFMQAANFVINSSTLATEPAAQPTNLTFSNIAATSFTGSFTAATGSPTGYLVLMSANVPPDIDPIDGVTYTSNQVLGTLSGNNVYNISPSGTGVSLSSITPGETLYFKIFSFNGSGSSINYLITSPLQGTITTLANEPASQPASLSFTNVQPTSLTLTFATAAGSPTGYIVLRKTGSSPTDVPADAVTYTQGATIGTSTVAYVGSSLTFNETGLGATTQYFYDVFAYNGSGVTTNYLQTSPLENNVSTLAAEPTSQPTSLSFTSVQATSYTASFTAASGGPAGYIVLRKTTSSPTDVPSDATTYVQGVTIGTSTVAYVGSSLTFNETGLTGSTQYFYDIFSYNGSGVSTNYLVASPLENSIATPGTLATEPTAQPTSLLFTNVQSTSYTASFVAASGSPAGYIVLRKTGSSSTDVPVDGTTYTKGATYGTSIIAYVGSATTFDETSLTAATQYFYDIFSYNGSGTTINYLAIAPLEGSQTTLTTSGDTTAPNVIHNAVASTPIGVALTITADITDNESNVSSAVLQWRSVTATTATFTDVAMTKGSGSSWSGQIPATAITNLGVEYKIKAINSSGLDNTASQTLYRTSISHSTGSLSIAPIANVFGSEQSKYRMIAIPLNLTNKTVDGIFASKLGTYDATIWTMYRLNNGTQKTVELSGASSLVPGEGYWFLSTIKPDIAIGDGQTVPTDKPFEITLLPKWNQIGNPYPFTIDWNDVLTELGADAAKISSKPRKYTGSKDDSQGSIGLFEGVYIENKSTSSITIKIPLKKTLGGRVSTNKHNPIDSDDWEILFTLENASQKFIHGGLGVNRDASNGFDYHDDSAMPLFADYLDIRFDNTVADRVLAKNVVPVAANYAWEFSVNTNMTDLPSTLSWTNDYFGENDKEIWLLNKENDQVYDMRTVNSINLKAGLASAKFKVAVGSLSFVKESTLPENSILSVSPNPVDDVLSISIALAKKSSVSVDVFDMSGRRVQSLLNGMTEKGRYAFEWDISRQQLGAGIYLVRMQTIDEIKYERIVKY